MFSYVLRKAIKQRESIPFAVMLFFSFTLSAILPYLNGCFLDLLISNDDVKKILKFATLVGILGIAGAFLSYVSNIITSKILTKTSFSLLHELILHLEHTQLSYIEKTNSAYVTQKIYSDVQIVTNFVVSNSLTMILNAVLIFCLSIFYMKISPVLLLFVFVLLLIYIILFTCLRNPMFEASIKKKEAETNVFGTISFLIGNIYYTQIYSTYACSEKKLNLSTSKYYEEMLKSCKLSYLFLSADGIVSIIFQSFMFIFGAINISKGILSVGQFLAMNSYFVLMLKTVKYYTNIYKQYQDAISSFYRLKEYSDLPLMNNGALRLSEIKKIEAKQLKYDFSGPKEIVKLFDELSFDFEKGKSYSVVGPNGSGKSTLIKIISALYETDNMIFIDGHSLKELDMDYTRERSLLIVPQKLMVPLYTVGQFIAEFLEVGSHEVMHIIQESTILGDFVESINLLLECKCNTLSEGELRKLYLWLAVNHKSDVLIFDEPTTSLDMAGKFEFIDFIRNNPNQQIIVIMTHDDDVIDATQQTITLKRR